MRIEFRPLLSRLDLLESVELLRVADWRRALRPNREVVGSREKRDIGRNSNCGEASNHKGGQSKQTRRMIQGYQGAFQLLSMSSRENLFQREDVEVQSDGESATLAVSSAFPCRRQSLLARVGFSPHGKQVSFGRR